HLVRRHLADQQKQGGIAGLQCSRRLSHEVVVDAEIGQPTSERAGSSSDRGASQWHHEKQTDQRAPKHPRHGAMGDRLEQLVQLDPSAVVPAMTASPSSIRYSFCMASSISRTPSAFASLGNSITSRSDKAVPPVFAPLCSLVSAPASIP